MAIDEKKEIQDVDNNCTENAVPPVFLVLFAVVTVFLIVYVVRFTPAISGWTSQQDYLSTAKTPGDNVGDLKQEIPLEKNASAVREGKTIFADYCADCHGEDATGDFAPNLTDTEWKYGAGDEEKFDVITKGRGADTDNEMPSFKEDLSEEQIWKVIDFIDFL